MLRSAVLLLALATPARAEMPVLSFEFPDETYVVPINMLSGATATPTTTGELGVIAKIPQGLIGPVTARNIGTQAIIRICGVMVSRPVIQTEIAGDTLMLPLETPADAPRLAAILNARSCATDATS